MGSFFSYLHDWAFSATKAQILILGLDASGKTTILNRLRLGTNSVTVPTIGFNNESFQYGNLTFMAWDIGGQDKIRKLWHHYFEGTDAIVYVIDSADKARFPMARDELFSLFANPQLKTIPFLILANKQDLPQSATTAEIRKEFNLYGVKDRPLQVAETVGITGTGIDEGFQWLSKSI